MPLKSPQPRFLLGIAALALALSSGSAQAGTPDRAATALWGPSSMLWLTEKPAKAAEAPTPDAAPRTAVQGETISGPGHAIKWCSKKGKCCKGMSTMHTQAAANAPLHARLETLRQEAGAIWAAKTFDREAFLSKRAEIRDLHNQIMQNNDIAAANTGAQLSAEQRAKMQPPCGFDKKPGWCEKKMQHHNRGSAKAKPAQTATPQQTESKTPEEKK